MKYIPEPSGILFISFEWFGDVEGKFSKITRETFFVFLIWILLKIFDKISDPWFCLP